MQEHKVEPSGKDPKQNRTRDVDAPVSGNLKAAQMAGLASSPPDPKLVTFVELLFFAYRDFTREADAVLAEYGLGRAHHRVLHFVNRSPGLKVAELLDILKITKQSLARVLKELVDQGWIIQHEGTSDRRQRLLYATEKGQALSHRLDALQARRVDDALRAAGLDNGDTIARFLFAMTSQEEREKVWALLPAAAPIARGP
jgi:DNA-binding MarR family transcriptional regulator